MILTKMINTMKGGITLWPKIVYILKKHYKGKVYYRIIAKRGYRGSYREDLRVDHTRLINLIGKMYATTDGKPPWYISESVPTKRMFYISGIASFLKLFKRINKDKDVIIVKEGEGITADTDFNKCIVLQFILSDAGNVPRGYIDFPQYVLKRGEKMAMHGSWWYKK